MVTETLSGDPTLFGSLHLGLVVNWSGIPLEDTGLHFRDITGPVVCGIDCPAAHPFRLTTPEPLAGNGCRFPPAAPQEFTEPNIEERYASPKMNELMGDVIQTRLSGRFGDEKIRFRNRVKAKTEAPPGNGGVGTESADKTVTFNLVICGRRGLHPC